MKMETWWKLIRENWTNLTEIVAEFCPSLLSEMIEVEEKEDYERMNYILNEAWWCAPDDPRIRRIPGWGVLCDLCSEHPE